MKEQLAKLLKVKSIVTIGLTIAFIIMLLAPIEVPSEMLALFSSTYGAVITYFFTRKDNDDKQGNLPESN